MRAALLLMLVTLTACGPSAEEQAREDAEAIAAVNAAQNRIPPIKALAPQQFTAEDFARMDDKGASCAFYLGSAPEARAIMVARPHFGWMKVDRELIQMTSDSGSGAGPLGTYTRYAGRENTVRIEAQNPDRMGSTAPQQVIPGQLMVRDRWDRVIFAAAGELRCAAQ